MQTRIKIAFLLIGALMLVFAGTVAAQEEPAPPCEGETVSGTVVAVDVENGTVTIETGEGPCVASVEEVTSGHPIVVLLGSYFGDINLGKLSKALAVTEGCVLPDDDTWVWASCEEEGATQVQILSENEDGTFTALIDGEEEVILVTDTEQKKKISEALASLEVDLNLEDGKVVQTSEEIAAFHDEGLGFGVLVKLYAIAADPEADVTVEELVEQFQSGTGLGEMFKQYGKPALLGVGHVRKASMQEEGESAESSPAKPPAHAAAKENKAENGNGGNGNGGNNGGGNGNGGNNGDGGNGNGGSKGVCNAIEKGGNAKAKGKEVSCP